MAQRTPPSWLQNGSHPAENDRLTQQALVGSASGVIGATSYAVTAQGSPNMTVNVAAGYAAVVGATTSSQGTYVAANDATVVQTITAADGTNPRIDIIFLQVNDSAYTGTTNSVTLSYLAGTPSASPAVPTPTGSATYYVLAQILVGNGVTSITQANITDLRVPAQSPLLQGTVQTTRLTTSGSALTAGGSIFGATNRPFLIPGRAYSIDAFIPFTKTTTGTAVLGFAASNSNFGNGAIIGIDSAGTISNYTASTSALNLSTSGSFTGGSSYAISIRGTVTGLAGLPAGGRINLNVVSLSAGSMTPTAGAYLTITDLGTSANIGNLG